VPIDWNRALERAEELKDQGYSDSQISAVLDVEAVAADHAAQDRGHENAQAARSTLQSARGALNAEAAPPGQQPHEDPIDRAFKLADQSGYQRGSDNRMAAYIEGIFEAARAGDPRVMTQGVPDQETRERWHEDAHKRQISNRDQSSMRHR
jgi:hypothetical protein